MDDESGAGLFDDPSGMASAAASGGQDHERQAGCRNRSGSPGRRPNCMGQPRQEDRDGSVQAPGRPSRSIRKRCRSPLATSFVVEAAISVAPAALVDHGARTENGEVASKAFRRTARFSPSFTNPLFTGGPYYRGSFDRSKEKPAPSNQGDFRQRHYGVLSSGRSPCASGGATTTLAGAPGRIGARDAAAQQVGARGNAQEGRASDHRV